MRLAIALLASLVCACESGGDAQQNAPMGRAEEQLIANGLPSESKRSLAETNDVPAREPDVGMPSPPEPYHEEEVLAVQADLCWQDYCPCEPPQGGMDAMLCRRLKAGLPVDDEMMSAGAGFRDAREQMEQFEKEDGRY